MPLLAGESEIGHNIREMERAGHPHKQAVAAALHKAYDAGAGVLMTHGDRALFLKRSPKARDHQGEWCCAGGSIEAGETPEEAARREAQEETGLVTGDLTQIDEGDGFVTFRHEVSAEHDPRLDDEHTEFRWAPMGEPPQPLHPGVAATLRKVLEPIEVEDAAWNESDHPRKDDGEFTEGGGSAPAAELSSGGSEAVTGKTSKGSGLKGLVTGKKGRIGPIKVDVFRTGLIRGGKRGDFFAGEKEGAEAYASIHEGAKAEEYTVEATNAYVTESHMSLHKELFGKRYQDAVWLVDKASGFKSSIEASRKVEERMAERLRSMKFDALVYTKPPAPAETELAVLNSKTARITKKGSSAQDAAARDRREYDDNNWYTVLDNPLSGVGVFEYAESSVVKGGDPRKMVGVYRSPEELSSPECVESFKLMPWTDDHPDAMLGPAEQGMVPAEQKGVHGVIGEQVYYRDGKLYGNIKVFSESLAKKIASGKRQLSVGYHCQFVPQQGVYEGKSYQYVQRAMRGNHLSSVRRGKMEDDARVMDAAEGTGEYFTFALDLKEGEVAKDTTTPMKSKFDPAPSGSKKCAAAGCNSTALKGKDLCLNHIICESEGQRIVRARDDEQADALDADTLKFIEDSFGSLVGELEKKGYSKTYATKVAGKVAAEKGMTGHDSTPTGDTTVAEKTDEEMKKEKAAADRKAARDARDAKRSGLDAMRAKDGMTSEEEEAADTSEAACDAEEEREDKEDESKEARDRKSARDRRAGARDARKGARDRAAKDARDAKGKGMDAAEVQAIVDKRVGEQVGAAVAKAVADVGPTLRREEASKNTLYGRLSPIIGAFDHAEMTLPAMAAYGLKKLGVTAEATDPVTALDFLLVGRAQAAPAASDPARRGSAQDASAQQATSTDAFFATLLQ